MDIQWKNSISLPSLTWQVGQFLWIKIKQINMQCSMRSWEMLNWLENMQFFKFSYDSEKSFNN